MFLGEAGYDCGHHFEKFQVTLATAAAHCVMLGKPLVIVQILALLLKVPRQTLGLQRDSGRQQTFKSSILSTVCVGDCYMKELWFLNLTSRLVL